MNSSPEKEVPLNKIDSIINFKELYYQERDRRIELQKQLELEKIKVKKLMSQHPKSKTRYCAQCSANLSSKKEISKDDNQLISQLKDFSEKIDSSRFSTLKQQCTEPSIMSKIENPQPNRKRHVGMIQNFAVFGIKEDLIREHVLESKSVKQFQGQILYSKSGINDTELQASRLVFPSGMVIKKCSGLKAKEKTIELISYCYTNLKGFILNFECPDSNFDEHFHRNDLLQHINPDHRLFCICIGIHDYTSVQNKQNRINVSLGNIQSGGSVPGIESQIKSEGHEGNNKISNKSIEDVLDNMSQIQVGITQRVFCIMSYYPFFTFFEDIIRNFINIVKMERLTVYKHNNQNIKLTIKQTDSKFQQQRITELFEDCLKQLQHKKINFNKEYQHKLIDQKKIRLSTDWDEAKTFFVREWIFSVLSMFTFQTFIELMTLIMLQDRVVFICQNSNILTHTIYLFSHVLFKPLNYSYPVVSIIPNMDEDYLHTPFPVVYGLLKKRKYIEENNILEKYDFTYVFLNPERADIYYQQDRKELLSYKSPKLSNNRELKELFRDLKKTRKKDLKSSKYQLQTTDYCVLASPEEKDKAVKIVSMINNFISEDIIKKLPSQVQIQNIKKRMDRRVLEEQRDQHTYLLDLIIENFKKSNKDPFILKFLTTQTVNNYLFV